ncbi:hypothetical protein HHK36_031299 [Tetracentron sinense]|uniref:BFN domain-containing protein n=1 Tax=Tetracentron sinense TaxID=13715 RepID=A0A834YDN9_TETSI|nr:hypothetical protein HHK36_031299 [Tetracentron sinense]
MYAQMGNETESISFDLRPSDAINIAVLCKVPIQVNKILAYSDGMRVVEPAKLATEAPLSDGLLFTELDRPDGQPCVETKEFDFVRNMLIAAIEERYRDAGILFFFIIKPVSDLGVCLGTRDMAYKLRSSNEARNKKTVLLDESGKMGLLWRSSKSPFRASARRTQIISHAIASKQPPSVRRTCE